jgi:hypothetical protein
MLAWTGSVKAVWFSLLPKEDWRFRTTCRVAVGNGGRSALSIAP